MNRVEYGYVLLNHKWSVLFISMMMIYHKIFIVTIAYQTENILCWTFSRKIYGNSSGNPSIVLFLSSNLSEFKHKSLWFIIISVWMELGLSWAAFYSIFIPAPIIWCTWVLAIWNGIREAKNQYMVIQIGIRRFLKPWAATFCFIALHLNFIFNMSLGSSISLEDYAVSFSV